MRTATALAMRVNTNVPESVDPRAHYAKSMFSAPWQMLESMSHKSKPSTMSWDLLRIMAKKDVIAQSIIKTRVDQIANFARPQMNPFDMGFRVQMRDHRKRPTKSDDDKIHFYERMILGTSVDEKLYNRPDFECFLRAFVRDSLTFDMAAFEVVNRVNGLPHSWYAVDGSTIRFATHGYELSPPDNFNEAKVGVVKQKASAFEEDDDPLKPDSKYVQIYEDRIINEYSEEEMGVLIRNQDTDITLNGYSVSELEILVHHVTSQLFQEQYNRNFFRLGSAIKGIINVPLSVPDDMLQAFRREWNALVTGVWNAWRTPVIRSEKLNFTNLHTSNRDMEWSEWSNYLIRCHGAIFAIDPYEFGFDIKTGTGPSQNSPLFESSNEAKVKWSKDRGLKPLMRSIERVINQNILWRIDPNYELVLVGLDAKTEKEAIDIRVQELQSYKTLDEVRAEADLKPLGKESFGDVILNDKWVQLYSNRMMMEQQQGGEGGEGGGEEAQEGEEQPNKENKEGGEGEDNNVPDEINPTEGTEDEYMGRFGKSDDPKRLHVNPWGD